MTVISRCHWKTTRLGNIKVVFYSVQFGVCTIQAMRFSFINLILQRILLPFQVSIALYSLPLLQLQQHLQESIDQHN